MVDTNNQERRKYNITDNEDINTNYWINGLLAWWSGFSLRTKLLAIATLVVSLLMTGITFFALNSIQRDAGMNDTRYARDLGLLLSGNVVVLEEKIQGPEVSVFALCDGKSYTLLPTAQDHKRLNEKDRGPNTGGMGAYSPAPLLTEDYLDRIIKEIIEPTINELNKRNIDYRGVIYFGLMITNSGPKVIEYNCRFGDPECQTIMPLMDQNFVFLLEKCSMGSLTGDEKIYASDKVSGCVIATSKGYPYEYKTGYQIKIGKIDSNDCQIFDSGTSFSESGKLLTAGGRVLSIVCQDKDFDTVFEKAYKNLKEIQFEGIYFRNDIGHQVRKNFCKEN